MRPKSSEDSPIPLVEGIDYYLEEGKWVFTAVFLSRRGYCCQNQCRHCPYRDKEEIAPSNSNFDTIFEEFLPDS